MRLREGIKLSKRRVRKRWDEGETEWNKQSSGKLRRVIERRHAS
jgi:hypothetical protein